MISDVVEAGNKNPKSSVDATNDDVAKSIKNVLGQIMRRSKAKPAKGASPTTSIKQYDSNSKLESKRVLGEVYDNVTVRRAGTIVLIIVILSVICYLQLSGWTPLDNVFAYESILKNFNKWGRLVSAYEQTQSLQNNTLVPYMKDYFKLVCVDTGLSYIPMAFQLENNLLLPAAVRRGDGDAWQVTKSAPTDTAAYQQCLYVALNKADKMITCGSQMYELLSYPGYMNSGHWCNAATSLLYNKYKTI